MHTYTFQELQDIKQKIKIWATNFGFDDVRITYPTPQNKQYYQQWLAQGFHGQMAYMKKHERQRFDPTSLLSDVSRVISVRMNYQQDSQSQMKSILKQNTQAYISRYALGRDYHKVIRSRLRKLCKKIAQEIGEFSYRFFSDSAPLTEVNYAQQSGLGWQGKHSLLIHPQKGSYFFLGEIYTDLPLPVDSAFKENHCGTCTKCMEICPTQAIVAPYIVDARRCISYLTIEHKTSIPVELRSQMGNRIYGCDDCQLFCPWNRFAQISQEPDFKIRHALDDVSLVTLFKWSEKMFQEKMAGSAIYRIGYIQWLRNIAVALGNALHEAPQNSEILHALQEKVNHPSALLREHVQWALMWGMR